MRRKAAQKSRELSMTKNSTMEKKNTNSKWKPRKWG